jgi:regulator of sigma E protease
MGFLIFISILSFLIIVHEFGHLIMARRFGVKVERFSLGFGYRLLRFRKKDTEYTVSCIPLGGYVKLAGDNLQDFKGLPYEYLSKSVSERAKIVVSGPLLNYLLSFFFFWLVFFLGFPSFSTKVGEVIKGFPAEKAGILVNDIILKVDGKEVRNFSELQEAIYKKEGAVYLTILRGNEQIVLVSEIQRKEIQDLFGKKRTVGLIGIRPKDELIFLRYGFFKSFYLATNSLFKYTFITVRTIWAILTRSLSIRESITGPLGIFYITTRATRFGIKAILHLMAVLNLSLAIFNLFPFPVLDGGHLLFLGIEKIRKRRVSLRTEEMINRIGLSLIVFLAILVFYNDLIKFGVFEKFLEFFKR